jgi:hypothetical protein
MHHPMGDRRHGPVLEPGRDALADDAQRIAIRMLCAQLDGKGLDAGFAEVGSGPANALHLAVPQGFARQGTGGLEDGELDARRAAVQDDDDGIAHVRTFVCRRDRDCCACQSGAIGHDFQGGVCR